MYEKQMGITQRVVYVREANIRNSATLCDIYMYICIHYYEKQFSVCVFCLSFQLKPQEQINRLKA